MKLQFTSASAVLALFSYLSTVQCLEAGDLDEMYKNFNEAFLFRDGSGASYSLNIKSSTLDKGWTLARDIFAPEDVYFRRGDDDSRSDINALAARWLAKNPPSGWTKDCWNDDIAWYTEALARAYQTTGNSTFLEAAKEGNDLVYARGWETKHNDGGIWETQPNACGGGNHRDIKQALSTIPNGMTSCYIYQSTHNTTHFDRCKDTYKWTRDHLFNTTSGELYTGVLPNGTVDHSKPITDLGRWIEYANFMWMATGDETYYVDAKRAADRGLHETLPEKQGGVFSTPKNQSYDMAGPIGRGAGHFMRDNQLWSSYYTQFVNNSDHIIKNRDPKFHITSNNWLEPNPDSGFGSNLTVLEHASAVTWLAYTPPFNPSNMTVGIHTISNAFSKLYLESTGSYGQHQPVDMKKATNESTQAQRWRLTPNDYKSDSSYGLVNLDSWQALTAGNSSATAIRQNFDSRAVHQQWQIKKVGNNTYSIINKATGLALDGESSLTQKNYTGGDCQKWFIEPLKAPKA